jgi:hypothetical protein
MDNFDSDPGIRVASPARAPPSGTGPGWIPAPPSVSGCISVTFRARRGLLVKVIYGPGQRAPPAKGRDNRTGPTSPSGSGPVADSEDDFRVYASETVTTRPGSVSHLDLWS